MTSCSAAVDKREFLLELVSLCAEANAELAGVDPVVNPERYANQFEGLLNRVRDATKPEEDRDILERLLDSFSGTAERFRAAEAAKQRGDDEVTRAAANAADGQLEETSAVAQEYGMPPLTECEEGELPSASPAPPEPSESGTDATEASSEAPAAGWQSQQDALTARQQVAVARVGGLIHVAGGLLRQRATNKVEALDTLTGQPRTVDRLPIRLHHAMAVNYRDQLVVIGGWRPRGNDVNAEFSDRVFVLKPDGWDELQRLRHPRAAGAAAVVDDQIVVVGGQGPDGLVVQTEIYDGKTQAWRDGTRIPTSREHLAAAAHGRYVYAVGGRDLTPDKNVDVLERYDPTADVWETLTPMPTPRGSIGADVVDGRLIVVGGEAAAAVLDTVEAYDIRSDTWQPLPPLQTPRHGVGVASAGSVIYAINGARGLSHSKSAVTVEALTVPERRRQPTAWRTLNDAPVMRQQVAAAAAQGRLWVAGGLEDDGATAAVQGLDPVTDQWLRVSDLPRPLHHAMAVRYKGEFVVIGGWASDTTANVSDEVYALRDGEWIALEPLHHARAAGAAAVVKGKIVVAGGQDGDGLVRPTEVYDAATGKWTEGADIPTPREHLAAGAYDGYAYFVGGRDLTPDKNVAALERYDPDTDTWESMSPMPTARGSIGATRIGGRLAVVGGETSDDVLGKTELYDFVSDTWEPGPRLLTPRHGPGAAARGSSLYVIGGAERTSHTASSAKVEVLDFR